jgi:hypothetical protein
MAKTNVERKATQGKVFDIVKCFRIAGTKRDFRGIKFTFLKTEMTLFYGLDTGNKLFWQVAGKEIKTTDKYQFYKWLNKFEGADVRKLAGYTKLMKPVPAPSPTNGRAEKVEIQLPLRKTYSDWAAHSKIDCPVCEDGQVRYYYDDKEMCWCDKCNVAVAPADFATLKTQQEQVSERVEKLTVISVKEMKHQMKEAGISVPSKIKRDALVPMYEAFLSGIAPF